MSKTIVLAVLAVLNAAGVSLQPAQAQSKPRAGGNTGKPAVWSPASVAAPPRHAPLNAPKLPNRWQRELQPPAFGGSYSRIPKGANSEYRPAPIIPHKLPIPKTKAAIGKPFSNAHQPSHPATGGKQPARIKTQVVQAAQPSQSGPAQHGFTYIKPPHKPAAYPTNPHLPKPEAPVAGVGRPGHGPRNPLVVGTVARPYSLPQAPGGKPIKPPHAPPVTPFVSSGGQVSVSMPTVRHAVGQPTIGRPSRPESQLADPSPQPSRPAVTTTASATSPQIRVRVRSGPGRPAAGAPSPTRGSPRRTISLSDVSVSGGRDDGPVGNAAAKLSYDESLESVGARDALRSADGDWSMTQQEREAAADAFDSALTGELLTDAQRDLLVRAGVDMVETDLVSAVLAEDDQRRAALAGEGPFPSTPLSDSDRQYLVNEAESLGRRLSDSTSLANSEIQLWRQAKAGIEAMLDSQTMSPSQRSAVGSLVLNGSMSGDYEAALLMAMQQDAFLRFQEQQPADPFAGRERDWQDVVQEFADTVNGLGEVSVAGGGGGGRVIAGPVWPVGPGFRTVDPRFAIAGPGYVEPSYADPTNTAAAADAPGPAPAAAPSLESSGTSAVEPSAPAGRLAVFVQYETIDSASGEWKWYPNDPTGTEAVAYSLEAGQEVALKREAWSLNARRVRIWANTESGQLFDQFRGEDLWLVDKQPNGERYYIGRATETFSLAFGEEPETR